MKISSFVLLSVAALLAGCAHYQLGDSAKLNFSTISLSLIVNSSYAPQAHTYLSEALATEIMNSGKLTLAAAGKGQTTLEVELSDYKKQIGATSHEDTGRARSLDLTVVAQATLKDAEGKVLYSQSFSATDNYYADNGSVSAEQQALPLLLHQLAAKIVKAVLGVW